LTEIELKEYLIWLKKQIKESEDEITPRQTAFEDMVPNPLESRDFFFRTQELEVEFEYGVVKSEEGQIKAMIFGLGAGKKTENKHRIKLRLISQGHKLPKK
jgi:hypothetical protein